MVIVAINKAKFTRVYRNYMTFIETIWVTTNKQLLVGEPSFQLVWDTS